MQHFLASIHRSERLTHLIVVIYFTLMTVAYTFPLVFHMADSVVGDIGDNIYFVWLFGWYQKALFSLHINPYVHPGLNFPQGWNLATTDIVPVQVLMGLPGSLVFGPTWGYNFAVLATFVLSGWCMYTAVRKLSASSLAGLVAGTLFAFSPFRWARYLVGHLNLLGTFWLPVYFLAVSEFLAGARGQWRWLLAAALLLLGLGLSAPYYLYMGLIVTVVFALALLFFSRKSLGIRTALLRTAALFAALLPAALIAMLPYIVSESQGNLSDRSLQYASGYSGSPLDFVLPVNFYLKETLWDLAGRSLEHENALYIGVVCAALAAVAWIKRRELQQAPWVQAALVTSLVAVVLAMGVYLRFQDTPWVWHVPQVLQPLLGRDALRIPLPGYFLFLYMPFFAKMRVMMRFGIFTLTFLPMLAGLGSAWLFRRYPDRRYWIALGLLLAMVLDVYPGVYGRFSPVAPRPVDTWLAAQPGDGAVAQFPFTQVVDQDQIYYTLVHGKPFIGGFFNANQPEQYQRIKPVMDAFPDAASVALLEELGMQYIVVDAGAYADFPLVQRRIEELGLVLQTIAGDAYVYGWR
ncbi:MAG: hypothetical protein ACOYYS_02070 [Chloroflexota bacterium]